MRCSRGSKPALASGSQVAAGGDRGLAPRRSTRTPVRALPGKASCAWVASATWNALPAMGKPHHEHPRLDQRPGRSWRRTRRSRPRPPRLADGSAAPRPAPGPSRARPGGAPRRAIPSPPRTSRRARRPAAARPAAPCAAACAARPGRRAARSRSPPRTHRSPPAPAAHTPYAAAGPRWPAPGAPCAGARDGSRPAPGPTARQPPVTSDLLEQLHPRPRHPRPPHRRYRRGNRIPGGARIRDGTLSPPGSKVTTQVEPEFVKNNDPAGPTQVITRRRRRRPGRVPAGVETPTAGSGGGHPHFPPA